MIQYAKSALSESIIPVKDYALNSAYTSPKAGDLATLSAGKITAVTANSSNLVTTVTNLGVLEGTNFEGVEQARKVGKIRLSGNAIYRADYGTVATVANGGAFTAVAPTTAIIGETKAISKSSDYGFVVDSAATTNLSVKIVDVNVEKGIVYFQFLASALVAV